MLSVIVEVRLQHRCLRELMFVYLSQELVSRAWGLHIRTGTAKVYKYYT